LTPLLAKLQCNEVRTYKDLLLIEPHHIQLLLKEILSCSLHTAIHLIWKKGHQKYVNKVMAGPDCQDRKENNYLVINNKKYDSLLVHTLKNVTGRSENDFIFLLDMLIQNEVRTYKDLVLIDPGHIQYLLEEIKACSLHGAIQLIWRKGHQKYIDEIVNADDSDDNSSVEDFELYDTPIAETIQTGLPQKGPPQKGLSLNFLKTQPAHLTSVHIGPTPPLTLPLQSVAIGHNCTSSTMIPITIESSPGDCKTINISET